MMSIEPLHRQGRLRRNTNRAVVPIAWSALVWTLVYLPLVPGLAQAQTAAPARIASRAALAADPARPVTGTLFISGGGRLSEASLERFVDYGGGDRCRLVVITTASETAETPEIEPRIAPFRNLKLQDLCFLHTRERDVADSEAFCLPLTTATAVWFIGGHQSRLTEAYLDTRFERELWKVLERGGVIGGTSAGAAIMSQVMIKGGNPEPELDRGFGFLPGTVVDQHFLKRHRQDRLLNALSCFPELVGLGIDEGTTLVVQGRKMTVLDESDSQVMTCLAPTGERAPRTELLQPGDEVDLLALARSANRRLNPRLPDPNPIHEKGLPQGTVVLSGGGEVPREAVERFIEHAGGPQSLIIVITTAAGETAPDAEDTVRFLKESGATNTLCLHIADRQQANDPQIAEMFEQAGGVWFTGGRQWRVIDALEDTLVHQQLRELLRRDGVIGGSAAGASVLASYLVRGNPVSNRHVIGEGYEDGLGLLPGTAVDPYFSQRSRHGDMAHLKRLHPQLLGLGLDEGTAVLIRGEDLNVYGFNRVSMFDVMDTEQQSEEDCEILLADDRYNLLERSRVGSVNTDDDRETRRAFVAVDEAADEEVIEVSTPPLVCE